MTTESIVYKRICPRCFKSLCYSSLSYCNKAEKYKKLCKSCSHIGDSLSQETKNKLSICKLGSKNPFYGKHHTNETKLKLSKMFIGKVVDKEINEKVSKSVKLAWKDSDKRKNMIHGSKWKHTKVDKGQLELLEKWNKLGFNFIPNYQIKTDADLFYIDGYDKDKNVVLEYDSHYHTKSIQKQKNLIRQNKIINILNPNKFWRYDSVNNKIVKIL